MRSRRMAAAMSALAMVAGGLVSAAVIGGASPAIADHCEVGEQQPPGQQQDQAPQDQAPEGQAPDDQAPQEQAPDGQAPEEQAPDGQAPQDQDPGQQQDQPGTGDQNDQNGRQDDGDQPVQGAGGAMMLDPAEEPTAETFGRRGRPTRTPTQQPTDQPTDEPTQEPTGEPTEDPTASPSPSPTGTDEENECADLGPFAADFVDIRQIPPRRLDARTGRGGSRGSFVSRCGTNREGHNNPDNFIVAPGVRNGAHHLHDYVGNLSTDAFSTDESLAAADTTCRFDDKSTYYWPVLRNRQVDANVEDPDGNVGQVLRPRSVTLQFRGNAAARVTAMPRFLRIIMGDAKAATNGGANARAGWSCTGFTNRVSPDKYPLCPRGSQVARILDFPSCWDGQNADSANHRTHIVFPDQGGACPQGTRAVPQLRMTLTYSVPQGRSFAVDAFPEQLHNPVTDHADFVNVMPDRLMSFVVSCINRGRRC
ncbi:DUF1996 domain-containing protein [Nonomuraea sp. SBT364]|uniref:DUF1996 domain-containing protein n=1 Tax=Nonomuraea sp. SBT364 TaxID=1580530 RepID=UPI0007C65E90|nr:DUF1996 domain-containing protein [Nonomuraea sp. SBT364]